jgi:peroxiredoxin
MLVEKYHQFLVHTFNRLSLIFAFSNFDQLAMEKNKLLADQTLPSIGRTITPMSRRTFSFLLLLLAIATTSFAGNHNGFVPAGFWRGVFTISGQLQVPFNFEIKPDGKVYLLNAKEQFESGTVRVNGDSLFIPLDQFDNILAFKIEKSKLTGELRKQDGTGTPIPVKAEKAKYRFTEPKTEATGNFSGSYDILFKSPDGTEEKAVGLFTQTGNKLSATFLRVSGDSRFLEGIVDGNNFYLSTFIGSSPGYYKGSFLNDGKLSGEIIYARGGGQAFTGNLNEDAALPDVFSLTHLKDGYSSLEFSFPDVDGKMISLKDEKFRNKVVIVTITGTWCPNCIDEAAFLSPWYKENKHRGVEAIALHYERQTDSAFVKKMLTRFRTKYDIQYDQVIAGKADRQAVAESLPALNSFLAFPTTIFIDKKGNVAKIHTGYTGPATGIHYEHFKKEFNELVDSLLKN